jgi:hypothetical protein
MSVFNAVATIILVAAALVTVWFAWQASKESRKATEAALSTVAEVRKLLAVSAGTATSSQASARSAAQTVEAAKDLVTAASETVEIARAAHQADERDRLARLLRDIGMLVDRAFWQAAAESGYKSLTGWSCVEQLYLAIALEGIGLDLPKCHTLAGASQAGIVMGDSRDARDEIAQELRKLAG